MAPFAGEVFPNTPVTYTIAVINSSAVQANNVTVRDTIPPTFTLTASTVYGPAWSLTGSTLQWGPFNVPPSSQVTMGFDGLLWPGRSTAMLMYL